jgi:hypothetical protein
LFNYKLPGHPDRMLPSADGGTPSGAHGCPLCARRVGARDGISIAGVRVHLVCALNRRRAARR